MLGRILDDYDLHHAANYITNYTIYDITGITILEGNNWIIL